MSAINLKSITGITSITTPAGVDNQLTLHTNDTTQRVKVTESGVEIAGITTFSHTGANQLVIKDSDTSGDAAHMRISFQDSGGTEKFFVGNNNSNGWLYLGSPSGQNNNIAFRVNGNDKFQVNANGAYVNGDLTVAGNADIADSIIHTGDTNTKIRFPASDTVTVETAGTERFRITSSGRVGINQSSPSTNLDVVGNASFSGGLTVNSNLTVSGTCSLGQTVSITGTNPRLQFVDTNHNSDYSIYGSNGRFTIYDDTNSAERFKLESNGYVNIGTGTAQQQLTVQNSAQHSLIRVISKNDSDAGIDFGDVDDTDRAGIRYTNSTDTLTINANANTRVVIDSSGRVMIGGGSSPSQVGDGQLIVYSSDRLHPAIKPAGMINNYANGWTLLGDNYQADESQINLGVSYSSSGLVLSRGVKVSGSADDVYLSSQDSYATRPCAIKMDYLGAFNFLTTETNATVATDSAVSLTEVFKIDRVGNIYQKISGRNMYLGASSQLRLGVQTNGDPNIEAQSGDLKLMKAGSSIMQLRSDGFEMFQGIYPQVDDSKDLGKSSRRWANIYTTDLHLSNEGKSNVVDGTWGDWTLQEGEHKIYMINNRTGKKYSLKMEEE